jgi:hypothetical protein
VNRALIAASLIRRAALAVDYAEERASKVLLPVSGGFKVYDYAGATGILPRDTVRYLYGDLGSDDRAASMPVSLAMMSFMRVTLLPCGAAFHVKRNENISGRYRPKLYPSGHRQRVRQLIPIRLNTIGIFLADIPEKSLTFVDIASDLSQHQGVYFRLADIDLAAHKMRRDVDRGWASGE